MTIREEKLNKAIQRELTDVLHYEMKNIDSGSFTITGTTLSNDRSRANVFMSFEKNPDEHIQTLNDNSREIRKALGMHMSDNKAPELVFVAA